MSQLVSRGQMTTQGDPNFMVKYFDHVGKEPTGINDCRSFHNFSVSWVWQAHYPQTRLFTFIHLKRTRNVVIKNLKRLKLRSGSCHLVTDLALIQLLYKPQTYIETIYLWSETWSALLIFCSSAAVQSSLQRLQCMQLIILVNMLGNKNPFISQEAVPD